VVFEVRRFSAVVVVRAKREQPAHVTRFVENVLF
jgi:hypothetical protein